MASPALSSKEHDPERLLLRIPFQGLLKTWMNRVTLDVTPEELMRYAKLSIFYDRYDRGEFGLNGVQVSSAAKREAVDMLLSEMNRLRQYFIDKIQPVVADRLSVASSVSPGSRRKLSDDGEELPNVIYKAVSDYHQGLSYAPGHVVIDGDDAGDQEREWAETAEEAEVEQQKLTDDAEPGICTDGRLSTPEDQIAVDGNQ